MVLVLAATSVLAGENPNPRPFWGSFEGEVTFPLSNDCLDVTGVPFQTVSSDVEGKMTHLGHTDLSTTHCTMPDGSAAVGGQATFTAANGDEVWANYFAITVQPPPIIVQEITLIIYGGTGRFEGATGNLQGMVYATFEGFTDPSWPVEFVFAGWIVY
jgi:hypothetical protein